MKTVMYMGGKKTMQLPLVKGLEVPLSMEHNYTPVECESRWSCSQEINQALILKQVSPALVSVLKMSYPEAPW